MNYRGTEDTGKGRGDTVLQTRAFILGVCLLVTTAGCGTKETADAQQQDTQRQGPPAVEVAIAQPGKVGEELEYTGTTAAVQEVSLRSRVEGQVLNINVDVGDTVKQGQLIGQLDDNLLKAALNEAEAEQAALKAEVARAQNQVSNARAEVEQTRLELLQAQSDSQRQQRLVQAGAVAKQAAEQARTAARTAAQALRAAQEQVRTEQQAVAAAQDRVDAQQAVIAQAREQLSYARLTSPINGKVTQRLTEPGNFAQPNGEIIRIGDFSRVEVAVEVSELELAGIQTGQAVTVSLDAFAEQTFKGQVTRVSPAADRVARLVPIEVVIPNTNDRIGSGLLARVRFVNNERERVVVPESAILGQGERGGDSIQNPKSESQNQAGTVFVVREGTQATVAAREVQLGDRADGNVEVLSGLKPGERFVARSGRPLKDGETIRLSILSKSSEEQQ